jgi:hypothetical protein
MIRVFASATTIIVMRSKSACVIRWLVLGAIMNENLIVLAIQDLVTITATKECDPTAFVYLALPIYTCITFPAFSAGIWFCWTSSVPTFNPFTVRDTRGKRAFIRAWGKWVIDKVTTVVELPLISVAA